jgi:spore coat protein CotF
MTTKTKKMLNPTTKLDESVDIIFTTATPIVLKPMEKTITTEIMEKTRRKV